jgi:Type I phosphodiesterase / nucleotide pyrophosphatase
MYLKTIVFFVLANVFCSSLDAQNCQNIIIISTDGFRWQELFTGADSTLLFNTKFVADTGIASSMYWDANRLERRKKLLPFIWNYIEKKGQIWGNRQYDNKVYVSNPYHLSYAGYNEMLTGFADKTIIRNTLHTNNNENLLDYVNELPSYKNKVAFFGSWKLFEYILHQKTASIAINCGYQTQADDSLSTIQKLSNQILDFSENRNLPTRSDMLTHTLALEYLQKHHPKMMHIAYGETDEFAHAGKYDQYLQQGHQFDHFIAEIWSLIQSDTFYKNNTTVFITTDHGRGRNNWQHHGPFVSGSQESWLMQLGPNILPIGEVKDQASISAASFAQTIANYLGLHFTANHPVNDYSETLLEKNKIALSAR